MENRLLALLKNHMNNFIVIDKVVSNVNIFFFKKRHHVYYIHNIFSSIHFFSKFLLNIIIPHIIMMFFNIYVYTIRIF